MISTTGSAFVTGGGGGGGGGIGRAIALRLARDGWDIGVVDMNEAGTEETVALVRELGRRACVAVGNLDVPGDR